MIRHQIRAAAATVVYLIVGVVSFMALVMVGQDAHQSASAVTTKASLTAPVTAVGSGSGGHLGEAPVAPAGFGTGGNTTR